MAPPRILLVPTLTELEWRIKPLLEEWAEVASYDAPGVGDEPGEDALTPDAVVARGRAEIERRGWESCVIVGDEYGTHAAVHIAAARPEMVAGLGLGHACLSFSEDGDRPAISPEVMGAMRKLSTVDYPTYARHLTQVTQGAYDEEMVERYVERVPQSVARGFQSAIRAEANTPMRSLIASVRSPLLFAKHDGCLAWTDYGWEDAIAAFPDARTLLIREKPSCSADFADALRNLCSRLDF